MENNINIDDLGPFGGTPMTQETSAGWTIHEHSYVLMTTVM